MPVAEDTAQPGSKIDPNEVLFRQVHPELLHGGVPASTAFVPTRSDEGKLSVDRSSLTTAKEAFELYMANGLLSCGTYGVTIGEFSVHGLLYAPDPIRGVPGQKDNLAHAVVDYSSLGSTSKQKNVGKRLAAVAAARGVLHKPNL